MDFCRPLAFLGWFNAAASHTHTLPPDDGSEPLVTETLIVESATLEPNSISLEGLDPARYPAAMRERIDIDYGCPSHLSVVMQY